MNAKAKDDYVILAGEDVVGFLPSCTSQRLTDWLFEHYADDPAKYSLTIRRITDAPDVSFDFIGEERGDREASRGDYRHQMEMEGA